MSSSPRSELAGILFQEIESYLPEIDSGISMLQNSSANQEALSEVYRLFHNIKGAASQVAYTGLSNSAAICEALLADLLESSDQPVEPQLAFLSIVNDHIREFCTLDEKSVQAGNSLFGTTVSFFKRLMEQSGQENPIILPEEIRALLHAEDSVALSPDVCRMEDVNDLDQLRRECLASLRSIVPLLQELTSCATRPERETIPANILRPTLSALSTLAYCSRAAGLSAQDRLLCSFLEIVETFQQSPVAAGQILPGLLQEFLSYLELVFSLPPGEDQAVIATVQNHLSRVADVFSGKPPAAAVLPVETVDVAAPPSLADLDALADEPDFFQQLDYPVDDEIGDMPFFSADDPELLAIFQMECAEHLGAITAELQTMYIDLDESVEMSVKRRLAISRMRTSVHTMKGAAAMTGFSHIASAAYALEQLLRWLHEESKDLTGADLAIIHQGLATLRSQAERVGERAGNTADDDTEAIRAYLAERLLTPTGEQAESDPVNVQAFQADAVLGEETMEPDEMDMLADTSDFAPGITTVDQLDPYLFLEDFDFSFSESITEVSADAEQPPATEPDQKQEIQEEEDELQVIFQAECDEHLLTINRELNSLDAQVRTTLLLTPELREPIARMRRGFHTLKGAAAMTGFDHLATCAHAVEDLLDWLHDEARDIQPTDVTLIAEATDSLELLSQSPHDLKRIGEQPIAELVHAHLIERAAEQETEQPQQPQQPQLPQPVFEKVPDGQREEQSALPADTGNIRVKLEDLEELVNIEGELVVTRGSIEKTLDRLTRSLQEMDTIKDTLRRKAQELEIGFEAQSLYGFGPGSPATAESVATPGGMALSEFDPIELDRYSQLNLIIRSLNEIAIDVNALHTEMLSLNSSMQGQVARQQLSMKLMQEKLLRIRMTPLSSISRMLFRTVRQTASRLDKEVQLTITGEDVLMDRFIWSRTIDPLMHILRNCIDHGIEEAAARTALDKPAAGQITIDAVQRGRTVVLKIRDDGRGIDTDRLRQKLIAENIISAEDHIGEQELLSYLFRPSVSTRNDISQISGRGVGLDVVLRNIQELRGTINIINAPGQGVTFELSIPITLSVNRAIIIELGARNFAVPIQDITEVRKFRGDEILQGDKPQVLWNDKPIALVQLAPALKIPATVAVDPTAPILTLVINNGDEHVAMQIDRIEEQREVVIKNLGSHLRYVRGISGVTLTGEGTIIPILNLSELSAGRRSSVIPATAAVAAAAAPKRGPLKVLIVDDSISVRYSLTRLIEGQSWQALQAIDGIDALEKLETFTPDAIILDIEMPRMNGYEFMSVLRSNDDNLALPVIMLTSRASEKHRKKAMELGVNHYLTKPFQEDDFLGLLRSLDANRQSHPTSGNQQVH